MPGYGGQTIALDAQPFDLAADLQAATRVRSEQQANDLAQQLNPLKVQQAQQDTSLAQQLNPLKVQEAGQTIQQNALALAQAKRLDTLQTQATQEQEVARGAALNANAGSESWDAYFQNLADNGNPLAKQFVGRYSPVAAKQIATAFGTGAPGAQASIMEGDVGADQGAAPAKGAKGIPAAGPDTEAYARQFQNFTPPQIQGALQKADAFRSVLETVTDNKSWNAGIQKLVQMGALPPSATQFMGAYSAGRVLQLWNEQTGLERYLQTRATQAAEGLPTLAPDQETKEVGGVLYSRDPISGKWIQQTTATPKYAVAGQSVDAQGRPIIYDETTGQVKEGAPSGGGGAAGGGGSLGAYTRNTIGTEDSSGAAGAKNPLSSATGTGQFVVGTWVPLVKAARPDLAQGKTDAQIAAMRSDPVLSAQMIGAYAQQNADVLTGHGMRPSAAAIAVMHGLGPADGLKALTAFATAPDTPMAQVVGPAALRANPQFRNQTVGDYVGERAKRFGIQPVDFTGADAQAAPAAQPATALPATAGGTQASGKNDAYLGTLDPSIASQVKAISEGRMALPSGFAMRTPYWQQVMRDVANYDPSFDQANAPARFAARKSFTSGPDAANLTSINTVVGHLDTLNGAIAKLRNFTGLGTTLNPVANAIAGASDPAYQKARAAYDAARGTVAAELVKTLSGSAGAVHDRQYWLDQFDPDKSPDALKQAVQTAGDLIDSRLEPMRNKYQQAMGTTEDPFQTLYPGASVKLAHLRGTAPSAVAPSTPQYTGTPVHAAPTHPGFTPAQHTTALRFKDTTAPSGTSQNPLTPINQQEYGTIPHGAYYIAPDGVVRVKP